MTARGDESGGAVACENPHDRAENFRRALREYDRRAAEKKRALIELGCSESLAASAVFTLGPDRVPTTVEDMLLTILQLTRKRDRGAEK